MFSHHQRTLDCLVKRLLPNGEDQALILIGSVARGDAREDSDIDALLLQSDSQYAETAAQGMFHLDFADLAEPPCSGVGINIIDQSYLDDVEAYGNEPARWAFTQAQILFGTTLRLREQLQRLTRYPEEQRQERMMSFHSQILMHFSYLQLAEWSGNAYLLADTSFKIIHFAGRLILADNRMLYPNRKWFWRALKQAPYQTENFCGDALRFLKEPSIAKAEELIAKLQAYRDYPLPPEGWAARFERDSVRHWRRGQAPIEDW